MTASLELELERDLIGYADDVDRYLVLADALQSRGDPRGELIALQCTAASTPELRDRERELIAGFEAEMRGDRYDNAFTFTWRHGFVDEVEIMHHADVELERSRWLTSHPCLALLRSVRFRPSRVRPTELAARAVIDARLPALERIALGSRWMTVPSSDVLAELGASTPRLRALELSAVQLVAVPVLPQLEELRLWLAQADAITLDAIVAAPLPALNHLVIGFDGSRPPVPAIRAALAPVLDGHRHPMLAHLAVMSISEHRQTPELEDALLDDLPTRALLPRLRSFGLTWSSVSEEVGAPALERARRELADVALVWPRAVGTTLSGEMAYRLGMLLRSRLRRTAEALVQFAHATEVAPNQLDHWWAYGNALGDLERRDDQLAAYARALELEPTHPSILNNRGRTLVELGRFDEAIESFSGAAETPTYANAWLELGNLHRRFGRIDEAIACFERALAIQPAHVAGRHLIVTLIEYRLLEQAREVVTRLQAAAPDDPILVRHEGRILLALGDAEGALAIATRLCERAPDDYWNRYLQLCALRELGRTDEALACCDRLATDEEPSHPRVARLQRAVLARRVDELDLDGADGPGHDRCTDCAILAIAAAVLHGNRELVARRCADLDRFLASRPPGYARHREWDILDTIATIGTVAAPELLAILERRYSIATGTV